MHTFRFRRGSMRLVLGLVAIATCFGQSANATDSGIALTRGAPQTVAGTLGAGDDTLQRLDQDCSTVSGTATAVYYDTVRVTNTGSQISRLDVRTQLPGDDGTATCGAEADTVLAVYVGPFSPADVTANCVVFNDDSAAPDLDHCSRVQALELGPGEEATVVVMGGANDASFAYDLRFDGSIFGHRILRADFEDDDAPETQGLAVGGGSTLHGYPIPMGAGSHFNGRVDGGGAIDGTLALSAKEISDVATNFGLITLRSQFWHAGGTAGLIDAGGGTALEVEQLWFRLQSIEINGSPQPIGGDCAFGPMSWSLAGLADASLIDVLTPSFATPPMPADACNGYGATLNDLVVCDDHAVRLIIAR